MPFRPRPRSCCRPLAARSRGKTPHTFSNDERVAAEYDGDVMVPVRKRAARRMLRSSQGLSRRKLSRRACVRSQSTLGSSSSTSPAPVARAAIRLDALAFSVSHDAVRTQSERHLLLSATNVSLEIANHRSVAE